MAFLYDILIQEFGKRAIGNITVPAHITSNLKPGFGQRPYQQEAFQRFMLCETEDFEGKPRKPFHLLYNMATGSGKTVIMAGLILHLYKTGYRNFLFFVNSNNIIQKTKDNFLNPYALKYLFNDKIVIDGKEVFIKEIYNFEEADRQNINIKFTTIQQLHIDLNNTKENSITYEDFKEKKLVLIADEAHHLVAGTRTGDLFGSWEGTVKNIHKSNAQNILLEFTATIDTETKELVNHYQDKVIFKYDLAQFRKDRYSKEINIVRSMYDEKDRIVQALILNLYRQELAAENNINLKPVILFKAKRTISESETNKKNFHDLVAELSETIISRVQRTSTIPVVQRAFEYFVQKNISLNEIVRRIQSNFRYENCISANNDAEAEKNQILLNTLEDENNPIRAVFAVQKLNEGWDVLNLFDIVRLYEGQNTGGSNTTQGRTTLAEAQLIGRGARYFPFVLEAGQDKYTRKYDNDISNDLKVLEELYFHTKEDSRYISELKQALVDTGIYEDDDDYVIKQLFLKEEFKEDDFYLKGKVALNKKVPKNFNNVKSFSDLGVKKKNYRHILSSGEGKITSAFVDSVSDELDLEGLKSKDIKISDIPINILRYALSCNPFFYFSNLEKFNIVSISNLIGSKDFLGDLEITFSGTKERISTISNHDLLTAVNGLLRVIEHEIKSSMTEYEGSPYIMEPIYKVFKDKEIKVKRDSERADGQESFVFNEPWYTYNANYGTIEEKEFVKFFAKWFERLDKKFENIFLIRNERELKIYDKFGRAFEPDFLLFCKQRQGEQLTYQVFIEPKGSHLVGFDKWKEDFLLSIRSDSKTININTDTYLITAVPFYNYDSENAFKDTLESTLGVKNT